MATTTADGWKTPPSSCCQAPLLLATIHDYHSHQAPPLFPSLLSLK